MIVFIISFFGRFRSASGSEMWQSLKLSPIRYVDGNINPFGKILILDQDEGSSCFFELVKIALNKGSLRETIYSLSEI